MFSCINSVTGGRTDGRTSCDSYA